MNLKELSREKFTRNSVIAQKVFSYCINGGHQTERVFPCGPTQELQNVHNPYSDLVCPGNRPNVHGPSAATRKY